MNSYQHSLRPRNSKYLVLLDADLLLELLHHNRSPFVEEVEELFYGNLKTIEYIDFVITDKALRRIIIEPLNIKEGISAAIAFSKSFAKNNIIQVNASIIEQARRLDFPDFDSAIEHVCAKEYGLDAIITQNPSNYPASEIPIWSIPSVDKRISLENQIIAPQRVSQQKWLHGVHLNDFTLEPFLEKAIRSFFYKLSVSISEEEGFRFSLPDMDAQSSQQATQKISISGMNYKERLSFTLPAIEAQRLRQATKKGSISKKIRDAINLQLYLEEKLANDREDSLKTGSTSKKIRDAINLQLYLEEKLADGGEIFVRTGDGELLKLRFKS